MTPSERAQANVGTTTSDERPTLLLIGSGEPMEAALRQQLERLRVSVEHAPTAQTLRAVTAAAPDLVLLLGDAVKDGGLALLKQLAGSPVTSVVPVALLLDDASLDQRLHAFRTGAVAVIRRTATAHAIAQRIAELARELPERPGEAAGELGESTLDELVSLVTQELRSGILSVEGAGDQPVRLVLGAGGPVADALREFVAKLKPLVAEAEPLRYELPRKIATEVTSRLPIGSSRSEAHEENLREAIERSRLRRSSGRR